MKDSLLGGVSDSKVVLGDGRLGGIEGGGVSGRPGTVADGGVQVDGGVSGQIHVRGKHKTIMLVFSLQLTSNINETNFLQKNYHLNLIDIFFLLQF